ncbi:hypothetical protein ABT061_36345 [Streptosporangium sp. NPDC002544]|uniref:hypothetical protein n=1 Tax=Streptosporangium sp. NPDC002544 TaxID=3154538 RepID=UPI003332CB84
MNGNKRSLVIGALLGMVVGGSGIAVAGAVADSETITACVSANGTLRIPAGSSPTGSPDQAMVAPLPTGTAAPRECLDSERKISWNQTGPVGPKGEAGPVGPKGEAGFSGRENIKNTVVFPAHSQRAVSVTCPKGKLPVNASYSYGRADHWWLVDQMEVGHWGPIDSSGDELDTWLYRGTNPNDFPVNVQLNVMCAVLS